MEVLRDVMYPDDVEAVRVQAFEAVFDRAQGGVGRIVVDDLVLAAEFEQAAFFAHVTRRRVFLLVEDQAADLGTEHVIVAAALFQGGAQAQLGQAGAIERGRIEIADAAVPGRVDCRQRFFLGNVAEHIAQRRRAETQFACQ